MATEEELTFAETHKAGVYGVPVLKSRDLELDDDDEVVVKTYHPVTQEFLAAEKWRVGDLPSRNRRKEVKVIELSPAEMELDARALANSSLHKLKAERLNNLSVQITNLLQEMKLRQEMKMPSDKLKAMLERLEEERVTLMEKQ